MRAHRPVLCARATSLLTCVSCACCARVPALCAGACRCVPCVAAPCVQEQLRECPLCGVVVRPRLGTRTSQAIVATCSAAEAEPALLPAARLGRSELTRRRDHVRKVHGMTVCHCRSCGRRVLASGGHWEAHAASCPQRMAAVGTSC